MPTMKIPGIGPVEKKWVYVAGAAAVGIVGYAYWNKSRAEAAETEVSDYTDGTGYGIDSGVDEYVNPGGSQAPVEEDYVSAPTTNPEWSQKAIAILVDTGYDPVEASLAVGRYMLRQSLSSTQANMIRAASAQLGPPPSGDFPITVTPGTPTPSGPDPDDFPKMTAPSGLSAHDVGSTTVGLLWNAVSGARYYEVYLPGHSTPSHRTASTQLTIKGLKRNARYAVRVRAYDMAKRTGPWSDTRTFTTKK